MQFCKTSHLFSLGKVLASHEVGKVSQMLSLPLEVVSPTLTTQTFLSLWWWTCFFPCQCFYGQAGVEILNPTPGNGSYYELFSKFSHRLITISSPTVLKFTKEVTLWAASLSRTTFRYFLVTNQSRQYSAITTKHFQRKLICTYFSVKLSFFWLPSRYRYSGFT